MTKCSWGDVERCEIENKWFDLFFSQSCSLLIRPTWQILPNNKNLNKIVTKPRKLNFYLSELNCLLWGFLARISFINCGTWYPEQAHFWRLANFFLVFALICYLSCHAVLHQTRLPVANWQQNHGNLEINFCRQGSKVPSLKKGLENLFQYFQYIEV